MLTAIIRFPKEERFSRLTGEKYGPLDAEYGLEFPKEAVGDKENPVFMVDNPEDIINLQYLIEIYVDYRTERLRADLQTLDIRYVDAMAELKKNKSIFTIDELNQRIREEEEKLNADNPRGLGRIGRKEFYVEELFPYVAEMRNKLAQYEEWRSWPPKPVEGVYYLEFENGELGFFFARIWQDKFILEPAKKNIMFEIITPLDGLEKHDWKPLRYCGPFKAPEVKE